MDLFSTKLVKIRSSENNSELTQKTSLYSRKNNWICFQILLRNIHANSQFREVIKSIPRIFVWFKELDTGHASMFVKVNQSDCANLVILYKMISDIGTTLIFVKSPLVLTHGQPLVIKEISPFPASLILIVFRTSWLQKKNVLTNL